MWKNSIFNKSNSIPHNSYNFELHSTTIKELIITSNSTPALLGLLLTPLHLHWNMKLYLQLDSIPINFLRLHCHSMEVEVNFGTLVEWYNPYPALRSGTNLVKMDVVYQVRRGLSSTQWDKSYGILDLSAGFPLRWNNNKKNSAEMLTIIYCYYCLIINNMCQLSKNLVIGKNYISFISSSLQNYLYEGFEKCVKCFIETKHSVISENWDLIIIWTQSNNLLLIKLTRNTRQLSDSKNSNRNRR